MSPSEILCELIAIPSVNPMGRELSGPIYFEQRLSDWLVNFFSSIGAVYERIEVAPGRANVIARYDSPGATRTLLLNAHQDTVPIDNMTIDPFVPRVGDGRVTGRGASDVKGGLAAMLHAFARLVKEKPTRSGERCVELHMRRRIHDNWNSRPRHLLARKLRQVAFAGHEARWCDCR